MSERQYFKAIITYFNNCSGNDTEVLYICENNVMCYMNILKEDGDEPIFNGTDWRRIALAHALLLEDYHDNLSTTKVEECGWCDLPENIQKKFDYKLYRKEHPLRLFQYNENSKIKIYRDPIPEGRDEEEWLEWGCQPFDYIMEDPDVKNGSILCPPKACPVCGSRNITTKRYNDLGIMSGSAGYDDICDDCGYSYRTVTTIS